MTSEVIEERNIYTNSIPPEIDLVLTAGGPSCGHIATKLFAWNKIDDWTPSVTKHNIDTLQIIRLSNQIYQILSQATYKHI